MEGAPVTYIICIFGLFIYVCRFACVCTSSALKLVPVGNI